MSEEPKPKPEKRKTRHLPPAARVVIGYRTRLRSGDSTVLPEFSAPSHWVDQVKIAQCITEKRAQFLAYARDIPYTGILDEVFLLETSTKRVLQYKHSEDASKGSVGVQVANFLTRTFPDEWSQESFDNRHRRPKVLLIGFNIRTFLKILGAECTLPHVRKKVPLALWYENPHHCDIGKAVMPDDATALTLPYVLAQRRPVDLTQAKAWDELTLRWEYPGIDPQRDAYITYELAVQIGLIMPETL